jgi:hypothetical protein
MQLIVALAGVILGVALLVGVLAVRRIGRVASWHTLAMTARATGSLSECVAFVRFCAEVRIEHGAVRPLARARTKVLGTRTPLLQELPRAS